MSVDQPLEPSANGFVGGSDRSGPVAPFEPTGESGPVDAAPESAHSAEPTVWSAEASPGDEVPGEDAAEEAAVEEAPVSEAADDEAPSETAEPVPAGPVDDADNALPSSDVGISGAGSASFGADDANEPVGNEVDPSSEGLDDAGSADDDESLESVPVDFVESDFGQADEGPADEGPADEPVEAAEVEAPVAAASAQDAQPDVEPSAPEPVRAPLAEDAPVEERVRYHVAGLDGIERRPLAEHAQRYDEVHAELQAALTEIDGESGG